VRLHFWLCVFLGLQFPLVSEVLLWWPGRAHLRSGQASAPMPADEADAEGGVLPVVLEYKRVTAACPWLAARRACQKKEDGMGRH
jgi:hypothetical protein